MVKWAAVHGYQAILGRRFKSSFPDESGDSSVVEQGFLSCALMSTFLNFEWVVVNGYKLKFA